MKSIQLELFLRKMEIIKFLLDSYNLNYQEIAYILGEHPKVIEHYCTFLLSTKKKQKLMYLQN